MTQPGLLWLQRLVARLVHPDASVRPRAADVLADPSLLPAWFHPVHRVLARYVDLHRRVSTHYSHELNANTGTLRLPPRWLVSKRCCKVFPCCMMLGCLGCYYCSPTRTTCLRPVMSSSRALASASRCGLSSRTRWAVSWYAVVRMRVTAVRTHVCSTAFATGVDVPGATSACAVRSCLPVAFLHTDDSPVLWLCRYEKATRLCTTDGGVHPIVLALAHPGFVMSVEGVVGFRVVLEDILPLLHEWLLRTRSSAEVRDCVIACLVRRVCLVPAPVVLSCVAADDDTLCLRPALCLSACLCASVGCALPCLQTNLCRRGFMGPSLAARFLLPPVLKRLAREDLPLADGGGTPVAQPATHWFTARAVVAVSRRIGAPALATLVVPHLLTVVQETTGLAANPVDTWEQPHVEGGTEGGAMAAAAIAGQGVAGGSTKVDGSAVGAPHSDKPRRATTMGLRQVRALVDVPDQAGRSRGGHNHGHSRSASLHPFTAGGVAQHAGGSGPGQQVGAAGLPVLTGSIVRGAYDKYHTVPRIAVARLDTPYVSMPDGTVTCKQLHVRHPPMHLTVSPTAVSSPPRC